MIFRHTRSTRHYFVTVLLITALSLTTQAQHTSLDFTYGNILYRKNLGQQLNTLSDYEFGEPVQYAGIIFSGTALVNKKHGLSGNFLAAKYLPQSFQINDSVSGKLSGSVFGLTAGFDCFPKTEWFDIIVSGGLNLGRMKLVQQKWDYLRYKDNNLHLKNMLICPKVSLMSKIYLKKFCLTFAGEYAYDISGSRWKEKTLSLGKPESLTVPGFNQTGLYLSVGIGYYVPISSRSDNFETYSTREEL